MSSSPVSRFLGDYRWVVGYLMLLVLITFPWLVPSWWSGPWWVPPGLGLLLLLIGKAGLVTFPANDKATVLKGQGATVQTDAGLPAADQFRGRRVFLLVGLGGLRAVAPHVRLRKPTGWKQGREPFDLELGSHVSADGVGVDFVLITWNPASALEGQAGQKLEAFSSALRDRLGPGVPLHGVAAFAATVEGDAVALCERLKELRAQLEMARRTLGVQCPCHLVLPAKAAEALQGFFPGPADANPQGPTRLFTVQSTATDASAQQFLGRELEGYFHATLPSTIAQWVRREGLENSRGDDQKTPLDVSQSTEWWRTVFRSAEWWRTNWSRLADEAAGVLLALREPSEGAKTDPPYLCGCTLVPPEGLDPVGLAGPDVSGLLDALVVTSPWAVWTRDARLLASAEVARSKRLRHSVWFVLITLTVLHLALVVAAWRSPLPSRR